MSRATLKHHVGELRPSQLLMTFGIGSIVDLPNLAVMIMGLDDWPTQYSEEISEERLLVSVKNALGDQVQKLRTAPRIEETSNQPNAFDERAFVGVPVAPFPRWMVCPGCQLLAPLQSDLFRLQTAPYRPDKACYIQVNCSIRGRSPSVVPARFVVACRHGHLDDFPWAWYVHQGNMQCQYRLRLQEGISGEAADVFVSCEACGAKRSMAQAFGRDNEQYLPACNGRRPHLRDFEPEGCDVEHVTAMLQGASNSWFPVILSVLSIPTGTDRLAQLIDDHWVVLEKVESEQNVQLLRQIGQLKDFGKFSEKEIWHAVHEKRKGGQPAGSQVLDLKIPEWDAFHDPGRAKVSSFFELREVAPPPGYEQLLAKVVLAERLREVRALTGFTRIESPGDYDSPGEVPPEVIAPLARKHPQWVPAGEINGEGIFVEFAEDELLKWEKTVEARDVLFYEAHQRWREARGLLPGLRYPGIRYVLLHSFAHALIRQLAIECGYTAASIRERIYSTTTEGTAMAGVLIYTAAPDSEGTLGGLVSLGETATFGRHMNQAMGSVTLCASDPLCAEHHPYRDGTTLHGAACHSCLFLPETSCERGNKYLDRALLVPTLEATDLAFFPGGSANGS